MTASLLSALVQEQSERIQGQLHALDQRVLKLSEELQEAKHESSLDGLTDAIHDDAMIRETDTIVSLTASIGLAELSRASQLRPGSNAPTKPSTRRRSAGATA